MPQVLLSTTAYKYAIAQQVPPLTPYRGLTLPLPSRSRPGLALPLPSRSRRPARRRLTSPHASLSCRAAPRRATADPTRLNSSQLTRLNSSQLTRRVRVRGRQIPKVAYSTLLDRYVLGVSNEPCDGPPPFALSTSRATDRTSRGPPFALSLSCHALRGRSAALHLLPCTRDARSALGRPSFPLALLSRASAALHR